MALLRFAIQFNDSGETHHLFCGYLRMLIISGSSQSTRCLEIIQTDIAGFAAISALVVLTLLQPNELPDPFLFLGVQGADFVWRAVSLQGVDGHSV